MPCVHAFVFKINSNTKMMPTDPSPKYLYINSVMCLPLFTTARVYYCTLTPSREPLSSCPLSSPHLTPGRFSAPSPFLLCIFSPFVLTLVIVSNVYFQKVLEGSFWNNGCMYDLPHVLDFQYDSVVIYQSRG